MRISAHGDFRVLFYTFWENNFIYRKIRSRDKIFNACVFQLYLKFLTLQTQMNFVRLTWGK